MHSYKLTIAYDGTGYCGWQEQKNKPSITGELKKVFNQAFGKKVSIVGASRTDAGVHALGQVVLCRTGLYLPPQQLQQAWNNVLPKHIVIRSLEQAVLTFHPFYGVEQKTYYYHFFVNRPLPFLARYGWYYPYPIDHAMLKQALNVFVGTHNFASFRNGKDTREDTMRTIDEISLIYLKQFSVYRIIVKGKKFLRHMIRRIVGASIAVASVNNKASIDLLKKIMLAENPNHFLPNAPAHGLLLYNIIYDNRE